MIYRHHIAPPRAFTQFSHDLIRHPRLSSDAVRLLTWQLSLPEGAREPLSRTAERANIGATAFTRAKRQLKDEGFVHERRLQGPGGHWVTQQLVSSVPLKPAEAAKILARMPVAPASSVSPQVAPSPQPPTVGDPTPPPPDGYPIGDTPENTPNRPPKPPTGTPASPEPSPEPSPETLAAATTLVAAYPTLSPDLRHIPHPMRAELTALTARWLEAGHPPTVIRTHILRGLPNDGTLVHSPGGLFRHLLREVPPPPATTPAPSPTSPSPDRTPGPRLSARLTGTRECEGRHIQPRLFRPVGDENLCPACTAFPVR
ncbi:hypothetical protein QA802_25140 [Streptomyces sp. B21-105]|uniref:hypothetical protein n=1 Tax=Streptomyces sp. B21-105 TaxID=3039417 RepID=UPI002FF1819F